MPEAHAGREALQHTRRVLEKRPHKDNHELAAAAQCLAAFREELLGRLRGREPSDGQRDRLSRLNAVISVTMGMHFPLGPPPWEEFEKTQGWLSDLVGEIEADG